MGIEWYFWRALVTQNSTSISQAAYFKPRRFRDWRNSRCYNFDFMTQVHHLQSRHHLRNPRFGTIPLILCSATKSFVCFLHQNFQYIIAWLVLYSSGANRHFKTNTDFDFPHKWSIHIMQPLVIMFHRMVLYPLLVGVPSKAWQVWARRIQYCW